MTEQQLDHWTLKLEALVLSIAEAAQQHQKRYFIGGGFAIDLTFGGLSRPHGDVDFYPLEEDTQWWKDWFRSQGYVLYKEKDMENLPNAFSILTQDQVYVAEIYPVARGSRGEISMLVSEGTHDTWDEVLTIQGNHGLWQGKSWDEVRAVTYKGQAIIVENYHTVLHELENYRKRHAQEAYLEKHLHDFERAGISPHV
jgi:hypothetical protein